MDASLITVWGSPGAGKSTLAASLACLLAENHCVGLVSSNLQFGHLQVFFGQSIPEDKDLFRALEDPGNTKSYFQESGLTENLFLLGVPNDYTGLSCDHVSQDKVEAVLERARPFFDVLIIDGSGDIMNPVSSVSIALSSRLLVLHRLTAASDSTLRSLCSYSWSKTCGVPWNGLFGAAFTYSTTLSNQGSRVNSNHIHHNNTLCSDALRSPNSPRHDNPVLMADRCFAVQS